MLQKFINNIQLTLNLKQWYLKITILNYRRYCTAEQDDVEMADGGETQIHSSLSLDNGEIAAEDDIANANDLPEYTTEDDIVSDADQEPINSVFQDDAHDPAWVYNYRSMQDIGPNSYNTSKLISMELYDLGMIQRNLQEPLSTMKIMSLGDIISELLANPITRQDLEYRHNYDNREEDELSGKIADVFDGEIYKTLKDRQMFRNTYDQCIAIYNDGFVTDKLGSRLFTIVHVILLNQPPNKRYKDENMLQIAILPDPKKPASFNSFVSVILAEIQSLLTVNIRHDCDTLVLGCRFCYCRGIHPDNQSLRMYFVDSDAELSILEDSVKADPNKGYCGRSLITKVSTFAGPTSYVYNDMNGLARGVSSELFEMFTVDLLSSNNKLYYTYPNGDFEVENYPFLYLNQN
ncbi:hypothetical protein INT46_006025 [Mucor plumbeus]|uniref:Uncharacterized protein n=1 Tax=Mucor plumbeus TaxID=97098 RepID=A0A8H7UPY5_9FUNG|nr:hypothetical protein INT46_006025 [Mucor plumbeus]